MNALTVVFAALCIFAIGYRFYGLFIANKVLNLNDARVTPAVKYADGHDYVDTNKYVLFGHHFAAIAAAGPLLGPVLAAQFGYMPGLLWILIGCVLAGGVHDMVVLFASVRHRGQSLAYIASQEIDKTTGSIAAWAVLAILLLTLAGLSIAVVNAMHNSLWSTYTVAATIPIAIIMGLYMQIWRKGDVLGASIIGVVLLALCILTGPYVAAHPETFGWLDIDKKPMSILIPVYGFAASVLPVWMLLLPRDYLSTFLKIGTIGALALGIMFVMPDFNMPAFTEFTKGGGPIVGGPVIPFIFITIACGALSGFHATIGTGTTPKMIGKERDVLFVGYGAMLVEGFVAIMALIAACVLVPADYFAINAPADKFAALGMSVVDRPTLEKEVAENLMHRPGGSVSLAVGMAHIFGQIPWMSHLMSYWYHFAIMFDPHRRGRRHPRRPFRPSGNDRQGHPQVRRQELVARHFRDQLPVHGRVGLPCLHRRHFQHLAPVRHQQPAPCLGHAAHRHDHAAAHEQNQVCVDHRRPRHLHDHHHLLGGHLADPVPVHPHPEVPARLAERAGHDHDGLRHHRHAAPLVSPAEGNQDRT